MELEESTFLTSDYTTKLQSSRQYDTGTKTVSMGTLFLTKEAKIHNGEKTISLTSGAGKTGQPLIKEGNQNTF